MSVYYESDDVTLHLGDALDVLPTLDEASVDAIVCDPPYALPGGFMGKTWDRYDGREDAGFAYWLMGLIDGEGHFGIKRHARGTFAPFFALKMRADERSTLDKIRRELGIGTLADEDRQPNPLVKWVVQDKAGCQRLVDVIDKYGLRAKKRMDYAIWREAVCEWTNRPRGNRWHGAADNARMANLKGRIEAVRTYVDPSWSGHEYQDWTRLWATEALRVLRPGGHLLAFGGTRTWHRLACAIEDAGFEIRDTITWLYGQGFPKSLDVSKAIDAAAGAERVAAGTKSAGLSSLHRVSRVEQGYRTALTTCDPHAIPVTAPATDEAARWDGWGTALKPASEPIVVARKPLAGTVAHNVLAHGTGAINIDACRIQGEPLVTFDRVAGGRDREQWRTGTGENRRIVESGRWPTNVVLDGAAAAELDRQSGTLASGILAPHHDAKPSANSSMSGGNYAGRIRSSFGGDSGGASRFFPVFRYEAKADTAERPVIDDVAHPTVKPLALMRWLVRLVTPLGGVVLDPFAGSGTTVEAAIMEGFRAVAVEREPTYLPLITARIERARRRRQPGVAALASAKPPQPITGQGDLFDEFDGAA